MVRTGKLEATAEEVRSLHIDALAEQRAGMEGSAASAAGALRQLSCPLPILHPL